MAGRCYSQQMDHIQLSRLQTRLTTSLGNYKHKRLLRKIGIMKMFTLIATDHLGCEKDWFKLRSSCYFIGRDISTWEESRQKCIALNSDLVKITHDDDNCFLRDLAKGHNTYVGLSDLQEQGTLRWVADGTIHQIVESWWGEGEPNNPAEHCVHYYHSKDDRFNDANCGKEFRYICEKPAQLGWNFASVLDEETPSRQVKWKMDQA
ncbi:perlucin-like protein [Macrobrachium rosenbergii]|uniref:perlucin-like protein n=1 Tax=Macrobrachium rosenbergii TaxID=79674 RepID=UPI0034D50DBB